MYEGLADYVFNKTTVQLSSMFALYLCIAFLCLFMLYVN